MAHLEYYDNVKSMNDVIFLSHKQLIENICVYLKCPERSGELQKKFLDESLKIKKAKRDPLQPKRAKSAYMFFCENERSKLDSKLTCIDMAKELGERWRGLGEEAKVLYKEKALEDKERYANEMQTYKNNLYVT